MTLSSTLRDKIENICVSLTTWGAHYQRGILTVEKAWLIKQTTLYTRSHRHVNTHSINYMHQQNCDRIHMPCCLNKHTGWSIAVNHDPVLPLTDLYVKYFIHLVNITCQYMRTFSQQQTPYTGKNKLWTEVRVEEVDEKRLMQHFNIKKGNMKPSSYRSYKSKLLFIHTFMKHLIHSSGPLYPLSRITGKQTPNLTFENVIFQVFFFFIL